MADEGSTITLAEFKARTVMPAAQVDDLEARAAGYILARLKVWTSRLNARLRKRYAVPFAAPVPEIFIGWLVAIVTVEAYQKSGWNPDDEQAKEIILERNTAIDEVKEAADGEVGLFELPLRQDLTTSGVVNGGPFVYAEPSPYDFVDVQAEALRGR